jgi:hypothetical protein
MTRRYFADDLGGSASLLVDVPTVLLAYEKSPTTTQARASPPKRTPTMMTMPTSRRRSARLLTSLRVVCDAPIYDLFCRFCQICQV